MSDNLPARLTHLSNQLQQAADKHLTALRMLDQATEENQALSKQIQELSENIRLLKEENFLLKASLSPLNASDKKEFRTIINEYLRAIDKCINTLKT